MDISTLSKQLNIPITQLRAKMNTAGFRISPRANKIDNQLAKQVIRTFGARQEIKPINPKDAEIKLPKVLSVKDLAARLGLDVAAVIKKLIENGVLASINEEIDYDTATIIATDLGYKVAEEVEAGGRLGLGYIADMLKEERQENPSAFLSRPPIVAVMGHVDHGKTTLLDNIRQTKVVESEAGRITQHIGAYQVKHKDKSITFLDTPGHEAFSAMRARGANVTDMIVLVVAADDGIKPQTIEVINRARLTATPLIVAINKVDKPDANIERVKKELSDFGVVIEEWGGKVPVAKISALTGLGVDELLDLILLQAEILELKANPQGQVLGTVIESHRSKTLGPTATVLIQNGTLKTADIIGAGRGFGKIRTMIDAKGNKIKTAGPATPVLVTGISDTPDVGDILRVYDSLDQAKTDAQVAVKSQRAKRIQSSGDLMDSCNKELNLIIKVDVQGSLEAINEAVEKLKNAEVKLNVLEAGVGEVNTNDVMRADTAKALIIGFHTKINAQAVKLAVAKKVSIKLYSVIYELVEDLTKRVVDMLTPEVMRSELGRVKILAVFRTEKNRMIVGGKISEGKVRDSALVEIKRSDEIIGKGSITEVQQNKQATKEVLSGSELGLNILTPTKIELGDVLIVYEETVRKKNL